MSKRQPAGTHTTARSSGARALVRHLQRNVLPRPGRRAAVQAALRCVPGDPRTFRAIREVADFLPETFDPATEHAYVAVAAMICDQPARARNADIAAAQPNTDDSDHTQGEPTPSEPDGDDGDSALPQIRSVGHSCARAVNSGLQNESAMEARLHAICRSHAAGAHHLIPALVSFLRGGDVEVNWTRLIDDLAAWDRRRQSTAARWLREYYRNLTAETKKSDNEQEFA